MLLRKCLKIQTDNKQFVTSYMHPVRWDLSTLAIFQLELKDLSFYRSVLRSTAFLLLYTMIQVLHLFTRNISVTYTWSEQLRLKAAQRHLYLIRHCCFFEYPNDSVLKILLCPYLSYHVIVPTFRNIILLRAQSICTVKVFLWVVSVEIANAVSERASKTGSVFKSITIMIEH